SRHLPTNPLSQDAPAPIVIPRRLSSRALQPLPPPARPSTKLAPRNASTRDLSAHTTIRDNLVTRDAEAHDINVGAYNHTEAPFLNPPPAPNKLRTTDSVKNRTRTTEEPLQQTHKRTHVALFVGIVVPVILLILLIMPRVLGISIFPSGFPIFGTPPMATITITAQSKTVQDKYILTASPQVKAPDLNAHTIPARQLKSSVSGKRTIQTTGAKIIPGLHARGTVELINNTDAPAFVAAQTTLTASNGVQFQTVQDAQIPPRPQNNTLNVTVIAVTAGASGNIAADALAGPCCGNGITVKNNAPFSGGVDPQTVHTLAQADLDSVQNALVPNLEHQLNRQLSKSLSSDETSIGSPTYTVNTTSDNAIDTQTDQVQVTVTVTGTLTAYNRTLASSIASQLLTLQATHTLGNMYQIQSSPTIGTISIVDVNKNGVIYLSVPVHGTWIYNISPQQVSSWPQYIKGSTSAAALAYLNTQPGVAGVEIHLPFGADHLPSSPNEIRIVLEGNNATQTT
ncbi:MAG: baseplate J/gp47 family protein, partial [Ktedonobacteraceae bacterium]|nr:baseplate J/gp47 family protein [Ktedonobacteraceae bacterium]